VHVVHTGRPGDRPAFSTSRPCGRLEANLACFNVSSCSFVFRSLCYLLPFPLSPLSLHLTCLPPRHVLWSVSTIIEVTTPVMLPQRHLKRPTTIVSVNPTCQQAQNGAKEESLGCPEATSIQNHPFRSSTQSELLSYLKASVFTAKIHSGDA